MTRVIGGLARGTRLRVPETGTRPTSDRAREALFSSIESIRGPWSGARVLDLYAGSGACGLEAASRGAYRVDLVEVDASAVRAIAANRDAVARAGVDAQVVVHRSTVERWVQAAAGGGFDVVFCDPPYATGASAVGEVVGQLGAPGFLRPRGLVVLERSARDPGWQWPSPLQGRWDRRYGEAHLWIARLSP